MHKNHSDFTDKNYSHEAQDLYLFAINDEQLYTQQREPIEKNLQRKFDKGIYNAEKAVKLWGYFAETAAKKYHSTFRYEDTSNHQKWYHAFPPSVRKEFAELAEIDHRQLMDERAE